MSNSSILKMDMDTSKLEFKYMVFYETSDHMYRVISSEDPTNLNALRQSTRDFSNFIIETIPLKPLDINKFYMTKGRDGTDEELVLYFCSIVDWANELYNCKLINGNYSKNPFHYLQEMTMRDGNKWWRDHDTNIENMFKILRDNRSKKLVEKMEPIDATEDTWWEKCYNGGLMFCEEEGIYESNGFDFSNFYGNLMSSNYFSIPMKRGVEVYIEAIPKKNDIKLGFYNVKITSDDPDFVKVFAYSDDDVYLSDTLVYAITLQDRFNITIELITNVDFNAYIYDENRLTDGQKIFESWNNALSKIKLKYADNGLVKMIRSSLWGHLSRKNKIAINEDDPRVDEIGLDYSDECKYIMLDYTKKGNIDGGGYYFVKDRNEPIYKYNIRLKPFITARGRIKTGLVALQHMDCGILRIHTDGICFNKSPEIKDKNLRDAFIEEEKSTGIIHFKNVNRLFHICVTCSEEYKYNKLKHNCGHFECKNPNSSDECAHLMFDYSRLSRLL